MVSEESISVLKKCSEGVADLLKKRASKASNAPSQHKYSQALRSFALTLNFYSLRAYRFARKAFDTCLPHQRTLAKWCSNMEVRAGFTQYAFDALQSKANASREKGKCLKVALSVDEMAIRQHVEWDGHK